MKIQGRDKVLRSIVLFSVVLLLAGCASQSATGFSQPPGFLLGLFHGFTILFSLIGSTFLDVEIYAYPNTGLWYDVGYFLGVSSFCGGGGAGARAKKTASNQIR